MRDGKSFKMSPNSPLISKFFGVGVMSQNVVAFTESLVMPSTSLCRLRSISKSNLDKKSAPIMGLVTEATTKLC